MGIRADNILKSVELLTFFATIIYFAYKICLYKYIYIDLKSRVFFLQKFMFKSEQMP